MVNFFSCSFIDFSQVFICVNRTINNICCIINSFTCIMQIIGCL